MPGVVVLLARVCVGTRLGACGLAPSDDVGLVGAGAGLVVVVDGGYRADSFLRGSFCLEAAPSPLGFVLAPFNVLVVPLEALAIDTLRVRGLLTGSRLGEPWRGSESMVLEAEDEAADGPVLVVVVGFLRERERAMEEDIASLLTSVGARHHMSIRVSR